jgi:uroporphyrin-III C-methyltransferase/precorrin-2 dehydrogenase/sirohydrochlorin ferrochelatase
VTRHGPVTVAVTAGGEPRRAVAIRDAIAADLVDGRLDRDTSASVSNVDRPVGVALIGAGPGDPDLITVRGRRLLAVADVVIADRLASGLLLDEVRADAELIDASKIPYGPARAQEEINRMLVTNAAAGRFVVRLKGGDPFVFGRGGEEVQACVEAGIAVTVVPGVTSAVAAPAARPASRSPTAASRTSSWLCQDIFHLPIGRPLWTGRRSAGCVARSVSSWD